MSAVTLFEAESVQSFLAERAADSGQKSGGVGHRPRVVCINKAATVTSALQLFARHKILSAPLVATTAQPVAGGAIDAALLVFPPSQEAADAAAAGLPAPAPAPGSPYTVLSFLSIGDVMRSFVGLYGSMKEGQGEGQESDQVLWRMGLLSKAGSELTKLQVSDIGSIEDGDVMFQGASAAMPLLQLVRHGMLRWPRQRPALTPCHRVGVLGDNGAVVDVISQSDVIAFAARNAHKLGAVASKSIAAAGVVTSPCVTVLSTDGAIEAFSVMNARKLSAVAVVDATSGALVAVLSESDLRGMTPTQFGSLALQVCEFLQHKSSWADRAHSRASSASSAASSGSETLMRSYPLTEDDDDGGDNEAEAPPPAPRQPWHASVQDVTAKACMVARPVVCVAPTATLKSVIELLAAKRLHRVFVVDGDDGKPTGVVTLTDVLAALVETERD